MYTAVVKLPFKNKSIHKKGTNNEKNPCHYSLGQGVLSSFSVFWSIGSGEMTMNFEHVTTVALSTECAILLAKMSR